MQVWRAACRAQGLGGVGNIGGANAVAADRPVVLALTGTIGSAAAGLSPGISVWAGPALPPDVKDRFADRYRL